MIFIDFITSRPILQRLTRNVSPMRPKYRALDVPLDLLLVSRIECCGMGHIHITQGPGDFADADISTRDPGLFASALKSMSKRIHRLQTREATSQRG